MALTFSLADTRRFWFFNQGLGSEKWHDSLHALRGAGWLRTLGGIDVYLGLWARVVAFSREDVDTKVERADLRIVPAVRGCMYLVPEDEVTLALRAADLLSRTRLARDVEKAGGSEPELDALCRTAGAALQTGPATTKELRNRLGAHAVRSLGEAGKRVGMSSLLPAALRRLEFRGEIVRDCLDNRLDHERYVWRVPNTNPFDDYPVREGIDEVSAGLAERFFRWAGPATLDEFVKWSGLSKRQASGGLSAAKLVRCRIDKYADEAWVNPEIVDAVPEAPQVADAHLTSFADNITAWRRSPTALCLPALHDVALQGWGTNKAVRVVDSEFLHVRTVTAGDRVIGFWAYDPDTNRVEVHGAGKTPQAVEERAIELDHMIQTTFGHAKATSIDNDRTLGIRRDRLRAAFR